MNSFFTWRPEKFGFLNPYIIAEIGVNHGGDLSLAKKQIELAKGAGAHAVKFQMYKAHSLASEEHSPAYWDLNEEPTSSQFQLFQKYDRFSQRDYEELSAYCQTLNIDFSCTPFDLPSVDTLSPLVPFFKVASADLTNIPLLRKVGKTHKPMILSVGGSRWDEIDAALEVLSLEGNSQVALLHCVLNYPTPWDHAQMILQDELIRRYGDRYPIGYSDHVPPMQNGDLPVLDLSVMRGAVIIEKHFTHDTTLKGNDHYHAMSSEMLERWVQKLEMFRILYGNSRERNRDWEILAIQNARRRIYLTEDKKEGEILKEGDIIPLRGNKGLEIGSYDQVIGKKFKNFKRKGDYLTADDIIE